METCRVAGGDGIIGGLTGHAQRRNPGEAAISCERSTIRCLIQNGRIIHCSALTVPLQLLVKTHQAEATLRLTPEELAPIAAGVELQGHLWLMRILWN